MLIRLLFAISLVFSFVGCQSTPRPIEEYALARAALDAAKEVQAARYASGHWHQADEAYRQGVAYYEDRDWAYAKEEFIKARIAAEKAENAARLIRQKTGEIL